MDMASGGLAMLMNFVVKAIIWGTVCVGLVSELARPVLEVGTATDKDEQSNALGICRRFFCQMVS